MKALITFIFILSLSVCLPNQSKIDSLIQKGNQLILEGKIDSVNMLIEETLILANATLPKDNCDYVTCMKTIWISFHEYEDEEHFLKYAVKYKEYLEKSGSNESDIFIALLALMGNIYQRHSDYDSSISCLERALEISLERVDLNYSQLGRLYSSLGNTHNACGQYATAEEYYRKSLEVRTIVAFADPIKPEWGTLWHANYNLSFNCMSRNKFKEAEMLARLSHFLLFSLYEGINDSVINTRVNYDMNYGMTTNLIGMILSEVGKKGEAIDSLKKSELINERLIKINQSRGVTSISNLAHCYTEIDSLELAEKYYNKAYNMDLEFYKQSTSLRYNSILELAKFYNYSNKDGNTFELYIEGLEILRDIIAKNFPTMSERERYQFWQIFSPYFENFYEYSSKFYIRNPSVAGFAFDNLLLTKGILLSSSIEVREKKLQSTDYSLINEFNGWLKLKEQINKLTFNENIQKSILKTIDSLNIIAEKKEKQLIKKSAAFDDGFITKKITYQDIKEKLKDDEAAIEIIRFRIYGKLNNKFIPTVSDIDFTDSIVYLALIVKKREKFPSIVVIDNGNELESNKLMSIYNVNNTINQYKNNFAKLDNSPYSKFWGKISMKLKGIKKIFFSPDGVYNKINIQTLFNPETLKYLIDEIDIEQVTTTRDIIATSKPSTNKNKSISIFGNSFSDPQVNEFNLALNKDKAQKTRKISISTHKVNSFIIDIKFESIPGVKDEVKHIAAIFKKNNWATTLYLDDNCQEEFIKNINSPSILHIATHGAYLQNIEKVDNKYKDNEINEFLVKSFLIMKLLKLEDLDNERSNKLEDGILTAKEVVDLSLGNTDLVVLSLCESGLGEVVPGDGVYGLQRAFLIAGAKNLLMSLWNVYDDATKIFMESFYKYIASGNSINDAYKKTQKKLINENTPSIWGSFVKVRK